VASLAAAQPDTDYAALVFFSYPLHAPGGPDSAAVERTSHWPQIRCPVLLLSGEADPLARLPLLRTAVPLLRDAELVTYPGLGHTLKPVLDDALDRTARFLEKVTS
jgi:predicted alpha/beta-hydrolase family hydrolase